MRQAEAVKIRKWTTITRAARDIGMDRNCASLSTAADSGSFHQLPVVSGEDMDIEEWRRISEVQQRERLSLSGMKTYFIQREDGGPVKIGKSDDIVRRLAGMQCAVPVALVCIGYLDGNREDEMHERFYHHCIQGEWYAPAQELLDFIRAEARPCSLRLKLKTPQEARALRLEWAAKQAERERRYSERETKRAAEVQRQKANNEWPR